MTPDDCAPLLHCTADSLHIFIPINRLRNNAVSPGAAPGTVHCDVWGEVEDQQDPPEISRPRIINQSHFTFHNLHSMIDLNQTETKNRYDEDNQEIKWRYILYCIFLLK